MDGLLIPVLLVFLIGVASIWALLNFGGRWFMRRQSSEAKTAAQALGEMFIFDGVQRLQVVSTVVTIVLPLLAWILTGNLLIIALCVVLAFMAPRWVVRYMKRRRCNKFEQQLPDALLMITGALRAGASLLDALQSVVNNCKPPISQEFALLLREHRLRVDFGTALRNLERRVPVQDLIQVTTSVDLSREVGSNLAETLDSVGNTIRTKLQMEGKIKSLTAQGRMQGLVMTGLPVLLILVLRVMEPEAMALLFNTWYGYITLAAITLGDLLGYFFIRKITTIDV